MNVPVNTASVNAAPFVPHKPKKGDVIGWEVVDAETGEEVYCCLSRSEAREIARKSNGRVVKKVVD